jgi:hypothetical protein
MARRSPWVHKNSKVAQAFFACPDQVNITVPSGVARGGARREAL